MNTQRVTNIIEKILSAMAIESVISVVEDPDIHIMVFSIDTKDSNQLIGYKGEGLTALSHIIKKMYDNELEDTTNNDPFLVDINGYQRKHIDELKDGAVILAEQARYFKKEIAMDPMSAYDRMIVHSIFSDETDITTASSGVGRDRHVVLAYSEG